MIAPATPLFVSIKASIGLRGDILPERVRETGGTMDNKFSAQTADTALRRAPQDAAEDSEISSMSGQDHAV